MDDADAGNFVLRLELCVVQAHKFAPSRDEAADDFVLFKVEHAEESVSCALEVIKTNLAQLANFCGSAAG